MAAPNPAAQCEVIVAAAADAAIDLASVSYVEAHGTGTVLGDPVEIDGLRRAFAQHTEATGFAAIGSGKGNYGHLDAPPERLGWRAHWRRQERQRAAAAALRGAQSAHRLRELAGARRARCDRARRPRHAAPRRSALSGCPESTRTC